MKKKDVWMSLAIIAAASLTLYLYSRGKGYVEIDAGGANAALELRSSWFRDTAVASGTAPRAISRRVHRPRHLSISMKEGVHTWHINGRGPWASLSRIKIKNSETATLRLGPPFLVRPSVHKGGSVVSIGFDVIGQAGEQYENIIRKDDRPVAGAQVKIIDESGKLLESGKFQYG